MDFKKVFYLVLWMLLTIPIAFAQTTTVTGTVTDPGGNVWINATVTAQFYPTPNTPGPYTWSGGALNQQPAPVTTNGTGAFTITLPSNTAIVPSGSSWSFIISPNATQAAAVAVVSLTGGTLNLIPIITANDGWPSGNIPGTFVSKVYNTSQVGTIPLNQGAIVFDTTTLTMLYWNGSAWLPFSSGGGGGVTPTGNGLAQYSNNNATALLGAGPILSDAYNTANNGATQAQAQACVSGACTILIPSNSPDTEVAGFLPLSVTPSSLLIDQRNFADAHFAVNPQPGNNSIFNGTGSEPEQFLYPTALVYSEESPSFLQGATQGVDLTETLINAPGFDNGTAGCPLNCPRSPHTEVAPWSTYVRSNDFFSVASAGITNFKNCVIGYYGIGDKQGCGGAQFLEYAGGCFVQADECLHGYMSSHVTTVGDSIGTVTSKTDVNHMKLNITVNASKLGQGREIINLSGRPTDPVTSNPLTLVPINAEVLPGITFPLGTLQLDPSVSVPVSNAWGTLTNDCTVPVQNGGLATGQNSGTNGCSITVVSGTFNGTNKVCMAANNGNMQNRGVIPISMSGINGGRQILTALIHRSVQAGGIVMQGGMCGTDGILAGDGNTNESDNNTLILGSVVPIIGSYDAHTVAYAFYNAAGSSGFTGVPAPGSQWGTRATTGPAALGFTATNLTRTGGILSGFITSGGQVSPPLYQILNNTEFLGIKGCADATMNSSGIPAFAAMPFADPTEFAVPMAGADSTCAVATVFMQNTTVDFVYGTELLDVENHTNSAVDGTVVGMNFSNFAVNDTGDSPTSYAASSDQINSKAQLGQPQSFANNLALVQQFHSAIEGSSISVVSQLAEINSLHGLGGVGIAVNFAIGQGIFQNGIVFDTQFPTFGCALCTGAPRGEWNINTTNAQFRRFIMLGTDTLFNVQPLNISQAAPLNGLEWDDDSQSWWWFDKTGGYNAPYQVQNASLNTFAQTQRYVSTQWELFPGATTSLVDTTVMYSICDDRKNANQIPKFCFQNYIPSNAKITQSGTAGTTQYIYGLVVNDTFGPSTPSLYVTSTGNATLSGTNFNNIPCSDLPAGKTGLIVFFNNPFWFSLTGGTCSSNATVVHDVGTTVTNLGPDVWSAGGAVYAGAHIATGHTGVLGFTQGDIYGLSTPAYTLTADFDQPSDGTVCLSTTTVGNCAGTFRSGIGIFGTRALLSGIPACTSNIEGAVDVIIDSTTNTWGANVAGSGSFRVGVYCNGTNWTVYSK